MRSLLAVFGLLASFTVQAGEFTPVRDAVVQILGDKGSCSAVVISPTRLLTAKHCLGGLLKGNDTFEVAGSGLMARVITTDAKSDLAILELKAGRLKPLPACTRSPEIDDQVILVGYPLGVGKVLTEGRIQALEGGTFLTTTSGTHGNSGGGLFQKQDGKWCLVGIASFGILDGKQFITYMLWSVDLENIKRFIGESTPSGKEDSSRNRLHGVRQHGDGGRAR